MTEILKAQSDIVNFSLLIVQKCPNMTFLNKLFTLVEFVFDCDMKTNAKPQTNIKHKDKEIETTKILDFLRF